MFSDIARADAHALAMAAALAVAGVAVSAPLNAAHAASSPSLVRIVDTGVNPLAREPMYADIVRRAGVLRAQVEAYRAGLKSSPALADLDRFKSQVAELSALDMQGHVDLAKRGTDGDLKCILKGISQDLPNKLAEVEAAATPDAKAQALQEMSYLLRDNVEVITAPPTVQSGTAGL